MPKKKLTKTQIKKKLKDAQTKMYDLLLDKTTYGGLGVMGPDVPMSVKALIDMTGTMARALNKIK